MYANGSVRMSSMPFSCACSSIGHTLYMSLCCWNRDMAPFCQNTVTSDNRWIDSRVGEYTCRSSKQLSRNEVISTLKYSDQNKSIDSVKDVGEWHDTTRTPSISIPFRYQLYMRSIRAHPPSFSTAVGGCCCNTGHAQCTKQRTAELTRRLVLKDSADLFEDLHAPIHKQLLLGAAVERVNVGAVVEVPAQSMSSILSRRLLTSTQETKLSE